MKKDIENKVRIGIHADIVKKGFFRTKCDIAPIEDPYLESVHAMADIHSYIEKQQGNTVENTHKPPLQEETVDLHSFEQQKQYNYQNYYENEFHKEYQKEYKGIDSLKHEKKIELDSEHTVCPISPITVSDSEETSLHLEKLEKKEKPVKIPFGSIQSIDEKDLPKPKRKFKKIVNVLNKPAENSDRLSPKPLENVPSPSSAFYSKLKLEEEIVKEEEKEKKVRLNKVVVPMKNETLPSDVVHTIKTCITYTPLYDYMVLSTEN